MRLLQEVRTALEIHTFEGPEGEDDYDHLGGGGGGGYIDSIEARFPTDLAAPITSNSPIPSPPGSNRASTGLSST